MKVSIAETAVTKRRISSKDRIMVASEGIGLYNPYAIKNTRKQFNCSVRHKLAWRLLMVSSTRTLTFQPAVGDDTR